MDEIVPQDELLILDGIRRRDDSDRVGQWFRNAEHYLADLSHAHDQVLSILTTAQASVEAAHQAIDQSLAEAMAALQATFAEATAHAQTAADAFEQILTATSSAQVTQADLDALQNQAQGLSRAAHRATTRVDTLAQPDEEADPSR